MDELTRRRVVLTGGAGGIGRSIGPVLAGRWDLQVTDLHEGSGVAALDVTDAEACRAAFTGADAVIHLAANPSPDATWEDLHGPNVVGAYSVASAAAAAGVRRLVLASSLHTVSSLPAGRRAGRPGARISPARPISTARPRRGRRHWGRGWPRRPPPPSSRCGSGGSTTGFPTRTPRGPSTAVRG